MPLRPVLLALILGLAPAMDVRAQPVEVDLELVLLVDVSRSMSERELEIQRRGYAEALRSDAVHAAIQSGLLQTIALTYIEWAGSQEVVVPWRMVSTRTDLAAFADTLTARFDQSLRRTSISGALDYGVQQITDNGFAGLRRVIDISGDGPNNQGRGVTLARDAAVAEGIVINGLPLLTRDGFGQDWHLEELDIYYRECVIGGPGAFVIPVLDWADFAEAVRRKMVLEIAGLAPVDRVIRAQDRNPRDCQVGEKIWQDRQRYWDFP